MIIDYSTLRPPMSIKSLALPFTVGVYGGYYAVSRALDAHVADMAWQTVAWSGGQLDKRAVLYQLARQVLGAADVNLLETAGHDFGQWPRPAPPPPHGPFRHVADGTHTLAQIAAARHTTPEHIAQVTAKAMVDHAHEKFAGAYWTSKP